MGIARKLLIAFGIVLVLVAGFVFYVWHGNPSDRPITATMGSDPLLVEPEARSIPSVSIAKPVGWGAGTAPTAAAGLTVTRFAEGLDHPRTMLTLPNGDILVAETNGPPREGGGITGAITRMLLKRGGAGDPSPNRIVLLRDADGDGAAEQRSVLRTADMVSPSGMAYGAGKLYIANHNALLAFDFEPGALSLEGPPEKLMDLHPGGHWMRNLLLSPTGDKLYVAIGSLSNIGDEGMEAEQGRAAIWEFDLATKRRRQFAAGMRNPNGMAWNPSTGELWATVQERDMLGPDLVPDYLTNVPVGAQYGWPWIYWKVNYDRRVEHSMPLYMNQYVRKPEYALGAHVSALGLVFSGGGNRMGEGFANGDVGVGILHRLIAGDGLSLAHVLNTQVLPAWTLNMVGEDRLVDCPRVGWDVAPPHDRARAETITSAAGAITAARDAGLDVDDRALAQRFGIPLRAANGQQPELRLIEGGASR